MDLFEIVFGVIAPAAAVLLLAALLLVLWREGHIQQ